MIRKEQNQRQQDMIQSESSNQIEEEVAFDIKNDTRRRVNMENDNPYPAIGRLQFKNDYGKPFRGTAFFITPKFLLTAAHNIFDRKTQKYYENFVLFPSNKNQEVIKVKNWYIQEEYKKAVKNKKFRYDIGILQVQENYKYFMQVDWKSNGKIQSHIYVVGYPREIYLKDGTQLYTKQMYEDIGQYKMYQQKGYKLLNYRLPTTQGQSGAPVFYKQDNKCIVIGVHVGGGHSIKTNMGVLLTLNIKENLNNLIVPNQI